MCSLHANSAREAIVKLCTLPLLAGENVGHGFAQPRQHAQLFDGLAPPCPLAPQSACVSGWRVPCPHLRSLRPVAPW